ncbi:hypothetical protein [Flexithrix dorotheae]|uniref:hypothetical protein n=1 Tax=Flexithrix dorotheae TaxID=70993 RepID=UPI0003751342|nr:hypothetical protein [Flexithrix dorotheae]
MKTQKLQYHFTLLLLLALPALGVSQSFDNPDFKALEDNKWRVRDFNFMFGADLDVYDKMSMDYIREYAITDQFFDIDLSNASEEVYQEVVGGMISFNLTFSQPYKNRKIGQEFRVGVDATLGREAMVEYYDNEKEDYLRYTYCTMQNVYSLSASYQFRFSTYNSKFSFYTGIGGRIGTTSNSQILLIASEGNLQYAAGDYYAKARNAQFYKAFAPLGFDFALSKRIMFNTEFRFGVGYEKVNSGKDYFINESCGFQFGLRYNLFNYY